MWPSSWPVVGHHCLEVQSAAKREQPLQRLRVARQGFRNRCHTVRQQQPTCFFAASGSATPRPYSAQRTVRGLAISSATKNSRILSKPEIRADGVLLDVKTAGRDNWIEPLEMCYHCGLDAAPMFGKRLLVCCVLSVERPARIRVARPLFAFRTAGKPFRCSPPSMSNDTPSVRLSGN